MNGARTPARAGTWRRSGRSARHVPRSTSESRRTMLLPARVPSPFVVALIATRDRPFLLRCAVASVAAQSRPLDAVLIVEDASELTIHRVVAETQFPADVQPIVLKNRRTPGASGAWNTGL